MDWNKDVWEVWMKNRVVQYQIYLNCKGREIFFKDYEGGLHIRPMKIFSMQGIEYNLASCGFHEKPFHFYSGIAKIDWSLLREFPSSKKEWKAYREEFNQKFPEMVTGYDFVLDIDHKDIKQAWEIANLVREVMRSTGLPFYIVFSGSKGFHFRVDWPEIEHNSTFSLASWIETAKDIAKAIANEVGFKFGDDIDNIYDVRRVIRVPYSIHPKTNSVALPLSDKEFNMFSGGGYLPIDVLTNIFVKNRGLLKRPADWNRAKSFLESFSR